MRLGIGFIAMLSCCLSLTAQVAYCGGSSTQLLVKESDAQKSKGKITFGPVEEVDAGPTSWKARRLFLDGHPFGWAQADWKSEEPMIHFFSSYEIAYWSCADPECEGWAVLDLQNRIRQKLALPDFEDHVGSHPSAQPPYIAYGSVSKDGFLGCTVYDWQRKRVVAQEVTDLTVPATDNFGLDQPTFSKDGKSVTCVLEGFTDKLVSKKVTLKLK